MQLLDGALVLSPTDLTGFTACAHLTQLELAAARGELERPKRDDPMLDVLSRRGDEHEDTQLARLRADGEHDRRDRPPPTDPRRRSTPPRPQTLDAMRAGVDVIYQATFFDGALARPRRLPLSGSSAPSPTLGDWSYEVADTKLARRVKAAALLQMCGVLRAARAASRASRPRTSTSSPATASATPCTLADYTAYYRALKARFEARRARAAPGRHLPRARSTTAAICRWTDECNDRRRADDHLSLVAGMRRDQTRKLTAAGITTTHRARRARPPARTSTASATRRSSGSATRPSSRCGATEPRQLLVRACSRPSRPSRSSPTPLAQARLRRAARAVARRPLLRHGGRPLRARRRPRVPLRRRRARRRTATALPRLLGARPRRGEGRVRGRSSTS